MRTNNGKVRNVIVSLYFILIVLAIIVTTLMSSFSDLYDNPTSTILVILLIFVFLFILTHRISKYFEYDSDGLKVVMLNKGLLLSDHFNYREHKVEFEKEKLKGFKINNYLFYKNLIIYLEGRTGNIKKETFNVTLVGRKKRKYIKQSLGKMVRQNKKRDKND